MSLLEKYIKFIRASRFSAASALLVIPPSVVAYLFFPDVVYTTRLVVIGIVCTIIFSSHLAIGICGLMKKEFETMLIFLFVPLVFAFIALLIGFT